MSNWNFTTEHRENFYFANLMMFFGGPDDHEDGAKAANNFGRTVLV